MSQDQQKETIIARIKKLLKHAESAKAIGSLEEAETFSLKATELLQEYNLELSQIKLDENKDRFKNWMYGEEISFKDNQSGSRWRMELINVLTNHNFCNYTFRSYSKTFRVYGLFQNVDIVVWLYNYLSIGLLRLAQEAFNNKSAEDSFWYGKNRYSFLKDWLLGAVAGIDLKLKKEKAQSQHNNQINALVLVNKKALDEFINKEVSNLKQPRSSRNIIVKSAYEKGLKAGENYNINKPLSTTKSIKQLN